MKSCGRQPKVYFQSYTLDLSTYEISYRYLGTGHHQNRQLRAQGWLGYKQQTPPKIIGKVISNVE